MGWRKRSGYATISCMKKKKSCVEIIILHTVLIGLFAIITLLKTMVLGGSCPLRVFLRIPCLFCGMTTAHLAALRLDFETAFEAHPLFLGGIPYLFLLFHPQVFRGRLKKVRKVVLSLLTIVFVGIYFIQLLDGLLI